MDQEQKDLSKAAAEIARVARALGLDFYPVHFEICPAEALYTFGSYGMPTRFSHWSFGKAFHRLKTQYDLNLSKIYEMVINTNPAYAFLLEGNHFLQNKLIISHVYAHVDFFKNNYYFARTPKDMLERMSAHAEKIREYEVLYGREEVEKILDAVLAIQEHVDSRAHIGPAVAEKGGDSPAKPRLGEKTGEGFSQYEDLWKKEEWADQKKKATGDQEDILLYLIHHAPGLEEWQRDILSMIRAESLYFCPQLETKIINEGWATFWHCRIMRRLELTDDESVEFSLMHSQVTKPSLTSLNPYLIGLKLWESLEKKYSPDMLLEIRKRENDISFIRNYLHRELIEELSLFNFHKVGSQWQVADSEWEAVKTQLLNNLINGGNPKIVVREGDFHGKGILYLYHRHEGLDLDVRYLEKTLILMQSLWKKGIYLETVLDGRKVLFECENKIIKREQL